MRRWPRGSPPLRVSADSRMPTRTPSTVGPCGLSSKNFPLCAPGPRSSSPSGSAHPAAVVVVDEQLVGDELLSLVWVGGRPATRRDVESREPAKTMLSPADSWSGSGTDAKRKVTASSDSMAGRAATSAERGGPPSWVTEASGSPPTAACTRRAPRPCVASAAGASTAPLAMATMPATTTADSQRRCSVPRTLNATALTQPLSRLPASPSTALAVRSRGCQHHLVRAWPIAPAGRRGRPLVSAPTSWETAFVSQTRGARRTERDDPASEEATRDHRWPAGSGSVWW